MIVFTVMKSWVLVDMAWPWMRTLDTSPLSLTASSGALVAVVAGSYRWWPRTGMEMMAVFNVEYTDLDMVNGARVHCAYIGRSLGPREGGGTSSAFAP